MFKSFDILTSIVCWISFQETLNSDLIYRCKYNVEIRTDLCCEYDSDKRICLQVGVCQKCKHSFQGQWLLVQWFGKRNWTNPKKSKSQMIKKVKAGHSQQKSPQSYNCIRWFGFEKLKIKKKMLTLEKGRLLMGQPWHDHQWKRTPSKKFNYRIIFSPLSPTFLHLLCLLGYPLPLLTPSSYCPHLVFHLLKYFTSFNALISLSSLINYAKLNNFCFVSFLSLPVKQNESTPSIFHNTKPT